MQILLVPRQVTRDPFDDIEPSYLPEGGIVFCSSRCNRFVPCWYVQVATLYRCDADGNQIRPLSSNIEQDNTPWLLPDGRVLYTRWEYVDRSREHFHHLWTMNPDATGEMTLLGNMHPGDVYLDAKAVPEGGDIIMVNSPHHGQAEHEGRIALVWLDLGADAAAAQTILNPGKTFRDPYPLSADAFLVALDAQDLAVKRMLSFLTLMPGEVKCHDTDQYSGRALLTGDQGPMFTHTCHARWLATTETAPSSLGQ